MSRRRSHSRRRAVLAAGATALLAASLAACGSGGSSGTQGIEEPSPTLGSAFDQVVPQRILDIPLTSSSGQHTSLAAFHGQTVMIADFMTLCEDVCPLITSNVATMADALKADGVGGKVALLEVTIDPHRDTTTRLAAYRALYPPMPADVELLRASPADSAALWSYFHVYVAKVAEEKPADKDWLTGKPLTYDVDHSNNLIFLDPDGHERFLVNATPDTQGTQPPTTLKNVLSDQGKQLLSHPSTSTSWTVAQGLSVFSWLMNKRLALPTG